MKLVASDYDPHLGITTEYWAHLDGKLTVRRLQDVEPVIRDNQAQLSARSQKSSKFNERDGLGTRVASIPFMLVEKLRREKGIDLMTCSEFDLKRVLNDPDYAKLRTAYGRL